MDGLSRSDLRVGSVALDVDGRQVAALRHVHLQGELLVVVLQGELDLAPDGDGAAPAALAGAAVDRCHRVRAGLCGIGL